VREIRKSQFADIHIPAGKSPRVNFSGAYLRHCHPVSYKKEDILGLPSLRVRADNEKDKRAHKETFHHKAPHKMIFSTLRALCKK
jgi:hypothetical protein